MDRQRVGGLAALIEAATFVVGFAMFATVLSDYVSGDPDAAESVAVLVDNQAAMYVVSLVIYVVFAIFLVVLALALNEELQGGAPALAQAATAFGLIWAGLIFAAGMIAIVGLDTIVDLHEDDPAGAETVWSSLDVVQDGVGGGIEIVGGLWLLLISWAALRSHKFPKILNYLGLVVGVAGIVTVVPALEPVTAVFGLGLIVWFVWLGIEMLRDPGEGAPEVVRQSADVT